MKPVSLIKTLMLFCLQLSFLSFAIFSSESIYFSHINYKYLLKSTYYLEMGGNLQKQYMKTQEITNKIPMSPSAFYCHPNRPSKYHCVIGPAWIEIHFCSLCKTVPMLCFVQLRLCFHKKFSTRTERPIWVTDMIYSAQVYVATWDMNSGSHACIASALSTESPRQNYHS